MVDFILQNLDSKKQPPINGYMSFASVQKTQEPLVFSKNQDQTAQLNEEISIFGPLTQKQTEEQKEVTGLSKAIPGYYILKNDESRSRQLVQYLSKFSTKEEVSTEVERLIGLGVSDSDFDILSGIFNSLQDDMVESTAETMLSFNGEPEKRTKAGIAVVKAIPGMKVNHQIPVTRKVIATENQEVIKEGSKTVSQFDKSVQAESYGLYFTTKNKDVQINLASQYGQYDKSCELEIHKLTMGSEFQDVLNLASSNIYKFDKENQTAAFQVTVGTNNEAAINTAVSQLNNYDKDAKVQIESIAKEVKYESVQQTLTTAKTQETKPVATTTLKSEVTETSKSDLEEVKDVIKNADSIKDIEEGIKNLSDTQKAALIKKYPNSAVIKAVLKADPSLLELAEISQTLKQNDNLFSLMMTNGFFESNLLGFLTVSAQRMVVEKSAAKGKLEQLNKTALQASVRTEYNKLFKQQEMKEKGHYEIG